MEQKKKIRIIIIVLAVLLALSLAALVAAFVHGRLTDGSDSTVFVPDNLITPSATDSSDAADADAADTAAPAEESTSDTDGADSASSDVKASPETALSFANRTGSAKRAASIELYNKQPEDNAAFKAANMFPGDAETKYYRIRVSYHDKITVHYNAAVRPGFEKLAEVLFVRVKLLSADEIMYDGPIGNMPESLTYSLASENKASDELYYEITAYLDTSVGNEYQNRELIADFNWWVEETGNLDNAPQTGDNFVMLVCALSAAISGCALIVLLYIRRRRKDENNG